MITSLVQSIRAKIYGVPIGLALSVILILGLLPAIVMGSYFVSSRLDTIAIADNEVEGVEALRKLQPIEEFVNNPPEDVAERARLAKINLEVLRKAIIESGHAEKFDSLEQTKIVANRLQIMADGGEADIIVPFDNLIKQIGDKSGLILDPELDSYYLMDIVLIKSRRLLRVAEELVQVHRMDSQDRDKLLLISRHRVANDARDLQAAMLSAIKGDKSGTLAYSNVLTTMNNTISITNRLVAGDDVATDHAALIAAAGKSWTATADALDRSLNVRKKKISAEMYTALAVCGSVVALVLLLAGIVIAAVTVGLKRISHRLEDLTEGDTWSPVPGTEFNNDVGVIANALQHFVDLSAQVDQQRERAKAELEATVNQVRLENDQLLASALEQQSEAQDFERKAVAKLAVDLERQVSGLLIGSRNAAEEMGREASAMAHSTQGVQHEASAAAIAANEIRLTMQSVAPEVESVARKLDLYTQSLGEAKNLAEDAVSRVDLAKQRINDFDEATGRAGAMLELITKVAHKTNMLALNASIEAVRVGEAGQGFMVVAEEVKALARSTRDAALDISAQIAAMEGANKAVASAFGSVLDVVNTLATQSVQVASGMNEQTVAIGKVEDIISAASLDLSSMVSSIDSADASASAAMGRSSQMLAASVSVSDKVGALDVSVRDFLGGMQSAQRKAA
jgi:methyl-accepting chemotaxis protein